MGYPNEMPFIKPVILYAMAPGQLSWINHQVRVQVALGDLRVTHGNL